MRAGQAERWENRPVEADSVRAFFACSSCSSSDPAGPKTSLTVTGFFGKAIFAPVSGRLFLCNEKPSPDIISDSLAHSLQSEYQFLLPAESPCAIDRNKSCSTPYPGRSVQHIQVSDQGSYAIDCRAAYCAAPNFRMGVRVTWGDTPFSRGTPLRAGLDYSAIQRQPRLLLTPSQRGPTTHSIHPSRRSLAFPNAAWTCPHNFIMLKHCAGNNPARRYHLVQPSRTKSQSPSTHR
jgi:hypothetical protein